MTSTRTDEPNRSQQVVILCHPDPTSFNHAIAETYCATIRANGQNVVLRDIYAMGFDPVLKAAERPGPDFTLSPDVALELAVIGRSDAFVLIYPIWFGSPPAMLKGYVERVLGSDIGADDVQHQHRSALLGGKRLLSFTTSATSNVWLNQEGQPSGLRSVFDQYLVHAFGMHAQSHIRFAHITAALSKHFADQYLRDVSEQARRMCAQIAYGDQALLDDPNLARSFGR